MPFQMSRHGLKSSDPSVRGACVMRVLVVVVVVVVVGIKCKALSCHSIVVSWC